MYIGAYCCVSALPYLVGLFLLGGPRSRLLRYSAASALLVILALVAFEALNVLTGIRPLEGSSSWSYPGDYLARGLVGWLVMFVPALGILAPLMLALWMWRRHAAGG